MTIVWEDFEDFLRFVKNPPVSTPTIIKYRRMFCAVNPFFDKEGWTQQSVLSFVKEKARQGVKNSTINDYRKLFRHMDLYLKTDCTLYMQKLPVHDTYFDVITKDELEKILAYEPEYSPMARVTRDKRLYTVLYLLLSEMALRIEEALAVKWEDWKGDYITIYGSKTRRYDDIIITQRLQDELAQLKHCGELIFPLRRQSVSKELQKRCTDLGINKKVSSHTFRRSFATVGLEAGISDKWIQEKGRWKNANSMDKYIRKSKRHQKEVLRTHPFTLESVTVEEKIQYAYELRRKYEDEIRALNLPKEEMEKILLLKNL